jgi:hypothetical protein
MRAQRTIEVIEALICFDTASRKSNLPLVSGRYEPRTAATG